MSFFLDAQVRTLFGKGVRTLRKRGILPAVVYGAHKKNVALNVEERALEKMRKLAGESSLIELRVEGEGVEKENVLIHDVDYDPVTHRPRHVDFLRVRMDEVLRVAAPFRFEGESPAVKEGSVLVKVMHEAEVEALPANLPHDIMVDISRLVSIGDRLTLADVLLPAGVVFVGDPESVVVLVEKQRAEAVEEAPLEAAQIEAIEVAGGKKEKEAEEEEESVRETEKKP